MTKLIQLTKGLICLIDDVDFERVAERSWCASSHGNAIYAQCTINNRRVLMHRMIMGAKTGQLVDHINQNTLDNRRSNLRFTSRSINALNSKRRGYCRAGKGFDVYLKINGASVFRKWVKTEEEAVLQRSIALKKHLTQQK